MPIPDYQTLMLPVLRLAARGETRVPALEDELSQEFGLTQSERDQLLPSGRQKLLHNRAQINEGLIIKHLKNYIHRPTIII